MPKTLRKILIYILVANFVFGTFGQIFLAPQKANAQNPPSPSITVSQPKYTDSTKKIIRFEISLNSRPPDIVTASLDTTGISNYKIFEYDPPGVHVYIFGESSLPENSKIYCLDGFSPIGQKGCLIVTNDRILGSGLTYANIPTALSPNGKGFVITKTPEKLMSFATSFDSSGTISSNKYWQSLAFFSQGYAETISTILTTADQETACKQVSTDWEALKDDIRSLSMPKPGSVSGQSANENWEVTTSITFAGLWAGLRDASNAIATTIDNWAHSAVGANSDAEAVVQAITQQTLKPTTQGENRIQDVIQRAHLLDQNLTNLIANNANCGSFGVKFRKFKWNKNAESDSNIYTSLGDLQNDISALVAVARQYYDEFQQPVTTAGHKDECGGFPVLIGLKTFSWMFCELGLILHAVAVYLLKKSLGWLTAIIGINVNMKFTKPQIIKSTTTGGTSD